MQNKIEKAINKAVEKAIKPGVRKIIKRQEKQLARETQDLLTRLLKERWEKESDIPSISLTVSSSSLTPTASRKLMRSIQGKGSSNVKLSYPCLFEIDTDDEEIQEYVCDILDTELKELKIIKL